MEMSFRSFPSYAPLLTLYMYMIVQVYFCTFDIKNLLVGELDKKLADHVTSWSSKERKWWYVNVLLFSKDTVMY